jgi:hypothetical protein
MDTVHAKVQDSVLCQPRARPWRSDASPLGCQSASAARCASAVAAAQSSAVSSKRCAPSAAAPHARSRVLCAAMAAATRFSTERALPHGSSSTMGATSRWSACSASASVALSAKPG